jgi:hypothetical protein
MVTADFIESMADDFKNRGLLLRKATRKGEVAYFILLPMPSSPGCYVPVARLHGPEEATAICDEWQMQGSLGVEDNPAFDPRTRQR